MVLEKRLDYLKPDFTANIAKKIKTIHPMFPVWLIIITTVSEYLNELRINYVL
jgi:hypothetical protein